MKITKITLAGISAVLILSPVASAQCCGGKAKGNKVEAKATNKPSAKVAQETVVNYVNLSSALYKDDLAKAKKVAKLIASKEKSSYIGVNATKIANSKNIKSARASYSKMSEAIVPAGEGNKAFKKAHCPMANGGKGGSWLQKASDKTVNNPYFGASMAHCGSFK